MILLRAYCTITTRGRPRYTAPAARWVTRIFREVVAGRCLAKRSLVPNDLYGVLHASELKWRGAHGFYRHVVTQRLSAGSEGQWGLDEQTVFREKYKWWRRGARYYAAATLSITSRLWRIWPDRCWFVIVITKKTSKLQNFGDGGCERDYQNDTFR